VSFVVSYEAGDDTDMLGTRVEAVYGVEVPSGDCDYEQEAVQGHGCRGGRGVAVRTRVCPCRHTGQVYDCIAGHEWENEVPMPGHNLS